ncbi:protein O-linked-mannose beta-1,2-N-acetylglucosaminyltransferase 1-like [Palaemon carinicauda]|uniref:protein O-linked-mannose beta-1,2-N-acetylglucosaminyltransferase 1-like n=1 Tax=Palaemon carinicauda TaxID=392227 RepID=UPI0035B647DB
MSNSALLRVKGKTEDEVISVSRSGGRIEVIDSQRYIGLNMMGVGKTDRSLGSDTIGLSITINTTLLEISINNDIVYSMSGGKVEMGHRWQHSGIHVTVLSTLSSTKLKLSLAQRFVTYQPAEALDLVDTLAKIRHGKIIIVAAVPEWLMFLGERGDSALKKLGFKYHSRSANGEPWVGIAVTGYRPISESIIPTAIGKYPASALYFDTNVLIHQTYDEVCQWEAREDMQEQAEFCRRYEGYGDLCTCNAPFTYRVRFLQSPVIVTERIPVVVVTANKPRRLFRLMKNLFTIPETNETDILAVVDGGHPETLQLLKVLRVPFVVHRPEGFHNARTNANVRFALHSVFLNYPEADKAIVLEDDLILSPDILRFFHQTSWVLNNDPTVFCVNAFNSNSLPNTASDTKKLLRSESFPMYGWMVRREYAFQVVTHWIPGEEGDWDWFLMGASSQRGRDVVSPEVSRTFHAGSAGAHVDGFEQHLYYNRMLTTTDPNIRLINITGVIYKNYYQEMKDDIARSEMLTPDPTQEDFLPRHHPGPFVVFVRAGTRNDEFFSFRVFMMSLKTYYWDTREIFRGVMRFNVKGRILYIVGCPLSQDFCHYNQKGYMTIRPTRDLILQVQRANNLFERSQYEMTIRQRVVHRDPAKEASLDNIF